MVERWTALRQAAEKLGQDLAALAVDLGEAARDAGNGVVPSEATAGTMQQVVARARAIVEEFGPELAERAAAGPKLSVEDLLRAIDEGEARDAAAALEQDQLQQMCATARALRHAKIPSWPPLAIIHAQAERLEAAGAEARAATDWIIDLLHLVEASDVAECAALIGRLVAAFPDDVNGALQIALAAQSKQLQVAPPPQASTEPQADELSSVAETAASLVTPAHFEGPGPRTPARATRASGAERHVVTGVSAVAFFSSSPDDPLPPASGMHALLGRLHNQATPAQSDWHLAPPDERSPSALERVPPPEEAGGEETTTQASIAGHEGGPPDVVPSEATANAAPTPALSPSPSAEPAPGDIAEDGERCRKDGAAANPAPSEVADPPRRRSTSPAAPQPKELPVITAGDVAPRIWGLIDAGEESLALLLVKALENAGEGSVAGVPSSELLEIAVLSHWGPDRPELYAVFQQREAILAARGIDAHDEALALFAAGALSARALLAPGSYASEALGRLEFHGRAGIVADLRDAILAFSRFGIPLTPELLRGARTIDVAEAAHDRALGKLDAWRETNRGALMRFARATNVWRAWLRDDGVIGLMVNGALRGDIDRVRRFAAQWVPSGPHWKEQLHDTDKQLAGAIVRKDPIEGAVLRNDFPSKLGELQTLCDELLTAHEQRSAPQANEHLHPRVEECRRQLLGAIRSLTPRLGQLREDITADRLRAAAHAVEHRVAWLERFLHADGVAPEHSLDPDEVLGGDFLRVEGVRLDRRFGVIFAPPLAELCSRVEQAAERGVAALLDLALAAEERGNTRTLRLALATAARHGSRDATWQAIQARLPHSVERAARQRDERAKEVETNLDRALVENLLPEQDIVKFRAEVQAVRTATEDDFELDELLPLLDDIRSGLNLRRAERATELSDRLARLTLDEAQRRRISGAVERRDLQVAEELIAAVERGDMLPADVDRRDPFAEFFPARCQRIHDWLEEGWGQLRAALREHAPATTPVVDLCSRRRG